MTKGSSRLPGTGRWLLCGWLASLTLASCAQAQTPGTWDELVAAHEAALKMTRGTPAPNLPPTPCGHDVFWLTYGYLQQGRANAAKNMVTACQQVAGTRAAGALALASLRARYLLDTEEWTGEVAAIVVLPGDAAATFTYEFTNAFGALRRGELALARATLGRLDAVRREIAARRTPADAAQAGMTATGGSDIVRMKTLRDEIAAMMRAGEGAPRDGLALLRETAAAEDRLPFAFGPPFIDKPAHELLGEALLDIGQPREAQAAFEKALSRTPERTPERTAALVGLMKAAAMLGDAAREAEIQARLEAIWHRADPKGDVRK